MGARGEQIVMVGGQEVGILFTNRALVQVEGRLKRGIIGIAEGFANGSAGLTEVVTLLHVGMEAYRVDTKAGGLPVSLKQAYAVLDKAGFTGIAGPVMEAVAAVLGHSENGDGADEDDFDPNG